MSLIAASQETGEFELDARLQWSARECVGSALALFVFAAFDKTSEVDLVAEAGSVRRSNHRLIQRPLGCAWGLARSLGLPSPRLLISWLNQEATARILASHHPHRLVRNSDGYCWFRRVVTSSPQTIESPDTPVASDPK
jgi:hypothetical protein